MLLCYSYYNSFALQGDGSGCVSIYGHKFEDENFVAKHTGAGLLSMVYISLLEMYMPWSSVWWLCFPMFLEVEKTFYCVISITVCLFIILTGA